MSLIIAIIAIVAADIALLALVAFTMSRAAKLAPHVSTLAATEQSRLQLARAGTEARRRTTGRPRAAAALSAQA